VCDVLGAVFSGVDRRLRAALILVGIWYLQCPEYSRHKGGNRDAFTNNDGGPGNIED